jgi:site-specific DNA-cytosine methylase
MAAFDHWALAARCAGFEVKWNTQEDIKTYGGEMALAREIHEANLPEIPFGYNLAPVDWVAGSPPCIGVSQTNPKAGPEHWANKNFEVFFEHVEELKPKFFVAEMVPRMQTLGKRTWNAAMAHVKEYQVFTKIFHIEDYGSPSRRARVYLFGCRHPLFVFNPLEMLPKTTQRGCSTVLEPLQQKWDQAIPDGKTLYPFLRKDGTEAKGTWQLLARGRKLNAAEPSYTVTSGLPRSVWHYGKRRTLSTEECAALMEYPPGFEFNPKGRKQGLTVTAKIIASGVQIGFTSRLLLHLVEVIRANSVLVGGAAA